MTTPSKALAAAEAGRGVVKLTGPQSVADPAPRRYSPAITEFMALERAARMDSPTWRLLDAVGALCARVEESGVRVENVYIHLLSEFPDMSPSVTLMTPDGPAAAHVLDLTPQSTVPEYTWRGRLAGVDVTVQQSPAEVSA